MVSGDGGQVMVMGDGDGDGHWDLGMEMASWRW